MRRLSLRARLLLGVLALTALGLAAADVATYGSLRSFLLDRVDQSLEAGHPQVESAAFPDEPPDEPASGRGHDLRVPGIDWYQVRTLGGRPLRGGFLVRVGGSPPRVPRRVALPRHPNAAGGERVAYLTASGYRVRASIEPQRPNRVLLVAAALGPTNGTLHRLLLIEVLATLAAVAAVGVLGAWVVRLGLRPLREIERTAGAIGGGDLRRRVGRAEPRTEIGRLGLALNAMLGQIETAFRARERSEQKLRRFVADASHELRTPLAAVRAYAELFDLGADRRPQDLARAMGGIVRESERMSLLVDDLLLLARLDEGRPLEREPVQLDRLVAEAVDTARTVEPERPIDLRAEPLRVEGDADRLRQIVDNLLANARSHTPSRTPVRVTVERRDGAALIEVADEGPGLGEGDLERVFERFYRADASRARASGGVGLGLSIVAAVAEAHGGTVDARSEPGRGATFAIELPLLAERA